MPRNVTKIVAAYTSRETMEHFTRVVPSSEIAKQNYNLAVSTSVKQEEEGEIINIIQLNAEIERVVARGDILRREINVIIAEIEKV